MSAEGKSVEVAGLTKRFGSFTAVDNVSFDVPDGEIFGYLGPNGAGKTTLIRMLTTLIIPTGGSAKIAGFDVVANPADVRRQIGVISQAMTSDLDLTGYENLDVYGRFYGVPARERKERIKYLLDMVGLSSRAGELVAAYSGGMRRRLEVARGLVHRPKILFLDEPSSGLDPQSRRVMWDLLRQIRQESSTTMFLTTHYMEEADALCSRIAIIDAGKVIVIGSPTQLKREISGSDIVSIAVEGLSDGLVSCVKALPFVRNLHMEDETLRVSVDSGATNLPALMDAIRSTGGQILSASIHEQSLEDVFIHFTGKSIREGEAKKVSLLIGAGVPQRWGR
ncbi:MAG: ATP-binding cassette domain-containing protein [Betaproteobacteria bacterium]|nr:ATP-binding cassette domain-containing protein [Betaproteobacteria bacterium]MDE2310445.1 ATP-binding cassette domain-containing protein [Betaproteobacteria bacterium]